MKIINIWYSKYSLAMLVNAINVKLKYFITLMQGWWNWWGWGDTGTPNIFASVYLVRCKSERIQRNFSNKKSRLNPIHGPLLQSLPYLNEGCILCPPPSKNYSPPRFFNLPPSQHFVKDVHNCINILETFHRQFNFKL